MTLPVTDEEEFQISVRSHKGVHAGLFIEPSLSIAQVKDKIRQELGFACSRLLLNDHPLHDSQLVSEANLQAGSFVRAAMAKQNLKKRRVNHKAGPTQRRRNKAKQAQEQLNNLLNSMTPAQKAETLKQIAEDNDEATQKDVECADEETQKELGQMDR